MLVAVISFIILLINIILWLVVFLKLKKKLSVDGIISKIDQHLNERLRDIQHQTSMCLDLVDGKISELKELTANADRTCKDLKKQILNYQKKVMITQNESVKTEEKAEAAYLQNGERVSRYTRKKAPKQVELVLTEKAKSAISEETMAEAQEALMKIPVVHVESLPEEKNNSPSLFDQVQESEPLSEYEILRRKVLELNEMGLSLEVMSKKLKRPPYEIQMILEFQG